MLDNASESQQNGERGIRGRRPYPRLLRIQVCLALRRNREVVDRKSVSEIAAEFSISDGTVYSIQAEFRKWTDDALFAELHNNEAPGIPTSHGASTTTPEADVNCKSEDTSASPTNANLF